MKIKKVMLPVYQGKCETVCEWLDASEISAVEGINWAQQCRVRIGAEWKHVALSVREVLERAR
jgi:hypothetical protein